MTIRILTDINPISVHENGASVVDAGIIIEKKGL
ncbi:MAG: acetate--CoA ligase family protein [Proteobacteria bacterium]|nr:acetate--CoA ligase family protein [Pseudomonadota bacterium]MBU3930909.1 acetate--CoA ligase family protein [Pseudomonadota bacterium]MBU4074201.1 acetate--CoA ligase family protein [Pseudomonadota bacterium]